jgi:hypothetical protein
MKKIVVIILLISNFSFSQKKVKDFKGVLVSEEYTSENYIVPDSICFFSTGDWESERYYNILFKKLKKQFKNSDISTKFKYKVDDSLANEISSFDDINFDIKTKEKIICFFSLGIIDSNLNRIYKKTGQRVFINNERIMYYDLFMILIDMETKKTLLKRKFSVESNEIYFNNNKNLARSIAQEIKN